MTNNRGTARKGSRSKKTSAKSSSLAKECHSSNGTAFSVSSHSSQKHINSDEVGRRVGEADRGKDYNEGHAHQSRYADEEESEENKLLWPPGHRRYWAL